MLENFIMGMDTEQMSPYFLPLVFSLFAGLSTGLGGLLVLCFRGQAMNTGVIACLLGVAASSMVTVSIVDLFFNVAEQIG
jgi:hypothetical protein